MLMCAHKHAHIERVSEKERWSHAPRLFLMASQENVPSVMVGEQLMDFLSLVGV